MLQGHGEAYVARVSQLTLTYHLWIGAKSFLTWEVLTRHLLRFSSAELSDSFVAQRQEVVALREIKFQSLGDKTKESVAFHAPQNFVNWNTADVENYVNEGSGNREDENVESQFRAQKMPRTKWTAEFINLFDSYSSLDLLHSFEIGKDKVFSNRFSLFFLRRKMESCEVHKFKKGEDSTNLLSGTFTEILSKDSFCFLIDDKSRFQNCDFVGNLFTI